MHFVHYSVFNWIVINLLWKSLFQIKFCWCFFSVTHTKNILFVISPTTSYLKTRLFLGISVEGGSELKIAGPADVLTLSNGWKMSEQTLLQHFKWFFFLNWYIHDVLKQIHSFQNDLKNQIIFFKLSFIFNYYIFFSKRR